MEVKYAVSDTVAAVLEPQDFEGKSAREASPNTSKPFPRAGHLPHRTPAKREDVRRCLMAPRREETDVRKRLLLTRREETDVNSPWGNASKACLCQALFACGALTCAAQQWTNCKIVLTDSFEDEQKERRVSRSHAFYFPVTNSHSVALLLSRRCQALVFVFD
eukprot:s1541_g14.t1